MKHASEIYVSKGKTGKKLRVLIDYLTHSVVLLFVCFYFLRNINLAIVNHLITRNAESLESFGFIRGLFTTQLNIYDEVFLRK